MFIVFPSFYLLNVQCLCIGNFIKETKYANRFIKSFNKTWTHTVSVLKCWAVMQQQWDDDKLKKLDVEEKPNPPKKKMLRKLFLCMIQHIKLYLTSTGLLSNFMVFSYFSAKL